MESRENVKGIAARVAVWSARHRALAIIGWLVFVVGVTVLSGQAGMVQATSGDYGNGESGRADRIVEQAGFPEQGAGEMVIITSKSATVDSPQVRGGDRRGHQGRARTPARPTPVAAPLDVRGRAGGARHVRHARRPGDRQGPGRAGARRRRRGPAGRTRSCTSPRPATPAATSSSATTLDEDFSRPSARPSRSRSASCWSPSARSSPRCCRWRSPLTAVVGRHRPARARQPPGARRRHHHARDAAGRPGRRRRLLPVLHPPRARRAAATAPTPHRALRIAAADLRPVDLGLRAHRDRRDGRHVPHPGRHVRRASPSAPSWSSRPPCSAR